MNSCSVVSRRRIAGLLLTAPTALATGARAQGRGGQVVTTTAMLADAVRALAGDGLSVIALISEGVDPHLYRPTRADTQRLLAADLVVLNGHQLEGRMGEVLARLARAGRRVLALAERLPPERLRRHPEIPGAADPHIWMDPLLWAEAAGHLPDALAPLLALGRAADGLAAYRARLEALHRYAERVLSAIPPPRRVLVTAHDAFGYFGDRYGFALESIQGISTESEATLARIEQLVALLVERRIPAVFAESSVPDRAMQALIQGAAARGHAVRLGGVLYSDSLGRAGSYTGTVEGMLDHNITTIARALGADAPPHGLNGRLAA